MEEWSVLSNGSTLDCAEFIQNLLNNNNLETSSNGYANGVRCLFDQILHAFLTSTGSNFRPIPPMLSDGGFIDLFKLFCVVREKGGYDIVCKNGLWGGVVAELGLDFSKKACIKLVYIKYLNELDQLLNKVFKDRESDCGWKLSSPRVEVEANEQAREEKDNWLVQLESNTDGKCTTPYASSDLHLGDVSNNVNRTCDDGIKRISNDDDEKVGDYIDDKLLDLDSSKGDSDSLKRKRESLGAILKWVVETAKHPCDPEIETDYNSKELRARALFAREALVLPKHIDLGGDQSHLQKKTKVDPSIYDDKHVLSNQSTGSSRSSKRISSFKKSCPCCKLHAASPSKSENSPSPGLKNLANRCKRVLENLACHCKSDLELRSSVELKSKNLKNPRKLDLEILGGPCKLDMDSIRKKKTVVPVDLAALNTEARLFTDVPIERHVRVGPQFQAEVPGWTGAVCKSDPKWLGTRVWPPEIRQSSSLNEDLIGKGRPDSCNCQLPGSVNCVRFHIAEKRMKLKLELGLVFYHWRVGHMGEEVSLGWTIQEEKRFTQMVRSNPPSLDRCFWDFARKYFPRKKREILVRYYFNVFVIRRRGYQNRVTPKDIDSDDDESEFGSLSESYGQEAVTVPGTESLTCTENKECSEVE